MWDDRVVDVAQVGIEIIELSNTVSREMRNAVTVGEDCSV
jgi:hypothetical protein